jgi:hypothetical protein
MRIDDEVTHQRALEHARWRVSFLRSLLESHQWLPHGGELWRQKNNDYRQRLAHAEEDLQKLLASDPAGRLPK